MAQQLHRFALFLALMAGVGFLGAPTSPAKSANPNEAPTANLTDRAAATEVRARHVLLETEGAAWEVIRQFNEGADFAELARRYSTGPSADNGGDLGYFGREQMMPVFEEAAFALEVGEISAPVKSQLGWHVILVEDKRSASVASAPQNDPNERVRVRHILVESEAEAQDMIGFYNKGKDFAALAELFSIDTANAGEGGALGYIERGDTVTEFEDAAFALEVGEISAPVKTQFGWHVILMEDRYLAEAEHVAEPTQEPETLPLEPVLFDPEILAERLNEIDLTAFEDLPEQFGAPLDPSISEVVNFDEGLIFQKVSISMDQGELESGIEFRIYDTPKIAAERRVEALVTPEIRRKGRYTETDSFESEIDFDASCAHQPLEEGETVTQLRCTLHPPGSQVLITAYTYGNEIINDPEDFSQFELGRTSLMFDLLDAIAPAFGELQRIEAALIAEGGAALRPSGGWVLDPGALTRFLLTVAFEAITETTPLTGPAGAAVSEGVINMADRELGLTAKIVVPMNGLKTLAGVEFWVFESPGQAKQQDAFDNTLYTPESVQADGSATVDTWSHTRNVVGGERSWTFNDVTCATRPAEDGFLPQQIRCTYLPPDRQVAIVSYIHDVEIVDEAVRDELEEAAFDLIQTGLETLLNGEEPLLAGRSPADNEPSPLAPVSTDDVADTETPAVPPVDLALVGSWQLYVPVGSALARLQFDIRADGTYSFWSDNPTVNGHDGDISAEAGTWTLSSPSWQDGGSYEVPNQDTAIITGKLGPAAWSRIGAVN